MSKICVLGSGGWGIALAISAHSKGHTVSMWSPFEDEVEALNIKRESEKLLLGVKIPEDITITTDINIVNGSDVTIIATPSFAVGQTAAKLKGLNHGIIVNVAKGFEKDTMLTLSKVIERELEDSTVVVLSGPSHAEEVARNVPTTVVAASECKEAAKVIQELLISPTFRIYTSDDVVGVEVGGALKNVIAVAAGIVNGLRIGDNTKAALMTRGLAEIARLGVKMGADVKTFMGLSGLGDLIVTCMSEHSRNNRFGNLIGKGVSVAEALETVGTVEGYYAAKITYEIANKLSVDMPITEQCYNILYNGAEVGNAIRELMTRPGKSESEEPWM